MQNPDITSSRGLRKSASLIVPRSLAGYWTVSTLLFVSVPTKFMRRTVIHCALIFSYVTFLGRVDLCLCLSIIFVLTRFHNLSRSTFAEISCNVLSSCVNVGLLKFPLPFSNIPCNAIHAAIQTSYRPSNLISAAAFELLYSSSCLYSQNIAPLSVYFDRHFSWYPRSL